MLIIQVGVQDYDLSAHILASGELLDDLLGNIGDSL
jgi:hypothetical protein